MRTRILPFAVSLALGLSPLAAPALAQESDAKADIDPQISETAENAAIGDGGDANSVPDAPQTLVPADMTPDQLIQFFTLFSASEEMEEALGPATKLMMATGKPVEGWREKGIDILAELSALEGGLGAFLLRDLDDEVLSVTDLSGSVRPDLTAFESFALRPEPVGLVAERGFLSFSPGVWLEVAYQRSRAGKALCYGGYFGVALHTARPYTEWSEDELLLTATVFALLDRTASREFCTIYGKDESGRYTTFAVTTDGQSLPAINMDPAPMDLIPRAKIDEFLKREPIAPSSQ